MSTSGAREGPARQGAVGPRQPAPAQLVKRGRGRPRKQPQEPSGPPTPKRPRGRPRGSKNKAPRATQKKAEPPGEKRPRGRPRKWPQKQPQPQEEEKTAQETTGEGSEQPQTSGAD